MAPFCEGRWEYTALASYSMESKADRKTLLALEIDVLLVVGWQRLIPGWLIQHCRIGAIGAHGSPFGITRGRGRSPQTWALILGKTRFSVSIFFITPDIDSGPIIDSSSFKLNNFDDIRTSYLKSGDAIAELISKSLSNGKIQRREARSQDSRAAYLPKRLPEDGEVDWSRSTRQTHNFVRALTRPYPGAFSNLKGSKLIIWRARPFSATKDKSVPGTIGRVFHDGSFLVKTADGWILVDEHEWVGSRQTINAGVVLPSCDFSRQMRQIIKRHETRYPGLPIHPEILRLGD